MGQTAIEKIFAKHSGRQTVSEGEVVFVDVDLIMGHAPASMAKGIELLEKKLGVKVMRAHNPDIVAFSLSHHSCLPPDDRTAEDNALGREFCKKYNIRNLYDCGTGNVHLKMIEKGHAYPGSVCVGGDSHSTIYGCLGAFGTASATDTTWSFATGNMWFEVPKTDRVTLDGALMKGVAPRDVAQYLLGHIGSDGALNRVLEYTGQFIRSINIYQRMIFSLLAYEMGAVTGFIEADDITMEFMKNRARGPMEIIVNDPDCKFENEWYIDVSSIEPMIACHPRATNVKTVTEVEKDNVKVHQAFLGGCTGSSLSDFQMAAEVLRGRKLHPETRLLVVPGTDEIAGEMYKEGLMEFFAGIGAVVSPPYCGPCQMLCYGNLAASEVMFGTHPRNQVGRAGPNSGVYTGSPYSVAASAVAGKIVDPRKYL